MARLFWNKGIDVVGVGGQFWIFALSSDQQMIYKYWDGAAWQPSQSGWETLGGYFISAPSVAARNFTYDPTTAQFDIAAVGTQREGRNVYRKVVFHKFWNGSAWEPQTGWDEIGSLGALGPTVPGQGLVPPVAITGLTGLNAVDIVALGANTEVLHRYLANGAWQPFNAWDSLGTGVTGAPALAGVDLTPLRFNVFGVGANNNILHKYSDGSAWHPSQTTWEDMGGSANRAFSMVAAARADSDVQFDVFGANIEQTDLISHKSYPASWQPLQQWETVQLVGFPVAVASGVPLNRVDLFVTYDRVRHCFKPNAGGGFSAAEDIGGGTPGGSQVAAAAADCVSPAPQITQVHVAYIGAKGMQHKYYDTNGWHPSQTGWDNVGNGLNSKGFYWGQQ